MDTKTYDLMANVPSDEAAKLTFGLLAKADLREAKLGHTMMAVTAMFHLLCLRTGVKPQDALLLAGNLIATDRPEYRAIRRYLTEEAG